MPRWEPDGRRRLQEAALDLFSERGFADVTVSAIAHRAGLSERTFFNHFADKRDVLFDPTPRLERVLVNGITEAPASATPREAIAWSLTSLARQLDAQRDLQRRRALVVRAHPELRERELTKLSDWSAAIADGLVARGCPSVQAAVLGHAGLAVFRVAFERWIDPLEQRRLATLVDQTLGDLVAGLG